MRMFKEDDMDIRKTRYKQMSTQELLELHAAGILGDMAYNLLESELRERGVLLPSRPKGEETLAQANSTKGHEEKRICKYAIWAWISPLIGLILLLVSFRGKNSLIIAIALFLLSIMVGAILTTWAFVERNRYSNALIHGVIGFFVNVIFIILTIMLVFFMYFIYLFKATLK